MRKAFLFMPFVLLAFSCQKKQDVFCTDVFMHLDIKLRYADGSVLGIDSAEMIRKTDNTIFFHGGASRPGAVTGYTFIDDSRKNELKDQKISVSFLAYKNGSVLASRDFVIGADACHVQIFSGDNDIVINK